MRHVIGLFVSLGILLSSGGCPGGDYEGYEDNSVVEEYTGDGDWVSIAAGAYEMGGTIGGPDDEQPAHSVDVAAFEMWRTEVTVAQYTECVVANACEDLSKSGHCNWDEVDHAQQPANCVDWHDADVYCTWVGGHLPTEAEWEYAARAQGDAITYPWGDDRATCDFAILNDDITFSDGCGEGGTWPVCSIPDGNTPQGLCDMAGNVSEWVHDWFHDDYTDAPTDGSAWEDPTGTARVLRGGCYFSDPDDLTVSARYDSNPDIGGSHQGFRCAR